ncbi:MAG: hypothetical protein JO340_14345 [Acidobacteriaceae bacterium]|nr:hypothetical protein [Acidobacteriaceae bacterium]
MEMETFSSPHFMQNSYLTHPAEEALERFLLHQCPEDELSVVETHVLACDSCISRLEALETQIAATRIALEELERERKVAVAARQHRSWENWLSIPNLSWAGAAAAVVAAGLIVTPQLVRHQQTPAAEVNLSAYRGLENGVAPEGRPLHVHFNSADLPQGPISVQLVNDTGAELWKGSAAVRQDKLEITAPKIAQPGHYFFRLYAGNVQQGELLREFAFQVK